MSGYELATLTIALQVALFLVIRLNVTNRCNSCEIREQVGFAQTDSFLPYTTSQTSGSSAELAMLSELSN